MERTASVGPHELDRLDAYVEAGAQHLVLGWSGPRDLTRVERLAVWR